jgi:hypothetical protein
MKGNAYGTYLRQLLRETLLRLARGRSRFGKGADLLDRAENLARVFSIDHAPQ